MKLTKSQLKLIIREQLQNTVLTEAAWDPQNPDAPAEEPADSLVNKDISLAAIVRSVTRARAQRQQVIDTIIVPFLNDLVLSGYWEDNPKVVTEFDELKKELVKYKRELGGPE
jgi:hypothetical protein